MCEFLLADVGTRKEMRIAYLKQEGKRAPGLKEKAGMGTGFAKSWD